MELESYVARILGWTMKREIEQALRAIDLWLERRSSLVIAGKQDIVPLALSLHRRAFGDRPFVVCDPKRIDSRKTVRLPANVHDTAQAIRRARGGSLCIHGHRYPERLELIMAAARDPECDVGLVICVSQERREFLPFINLAVPSVADRTRADLGRIVDEFSEEAGAATVDEESGQRGGVGDSDRQWIAARCAGSYSEIEKAAYRVAAIRACLGSRPRAARMLGMTQVSLDRWLDRRAFARSARHIAHRTC